MSMQRTVDTRIDAPNTFSAFLAEDPRSCTRRSRRMNTSAEDTRVVRGAIVEGFTGPNARTVLLSRGLAVSVEVTVPCLRWTSSTTRRAAGRKHVAGETGSSADPFVERDERRFQQLSQGDVAGVVCREVRS